MTTSKLKAFVRSLLIICVLTGLLFSLNGCKKKPASTEPSTQESSSMETTEETTPSSNTSPTETTAPAQTTVPTETTVPTQTTEAVVCEHILGAWKVEKTSTCTTEGSRYKECILCEQKVETEEIPKTDHVPGQWVVDKISTCTAEGRQHQNCTQCKATLIYITLAKAEHNPAIIPGYPATQENPGMTDGQKCTVCKAILLEQQVIPPQTSQAFTYTVGSDNKTCTITGLGTYTNSLVIIPAEISGYKVTAIGNNAFENNKDITAVELPVSVTAIRNRGFYGCSSLSSISFKGTKEQWFAITKGNGWNGETGNYTIHCTDGNITSN